MSKGRIGRIVGAVDPRGIVITVLAVALALAAVGTATNALLVAAKTVAPPTITAKPAVATTSTSASFSFTGSSGVTFQCSLDSATFTACASPKNYTGPLVQGSHTFQVKAISGTDQSAPTSYSWVVDTTPPPAPSFTAKPALQSSSTSASFGFADGEPGVSYRCKLDSAAAFTACSNPKSFSSLAQGSHTLAVQAQDAAGNIGPSSSYTWTVDTVAPPAPVITQKPTDPSPNATNVFAWTEAEAGTTFQCAAESGIYVVCTSPYTYIVDTSNNGQHQFRVRARDAAGNASPANNYTFKYEKTQPDSGVPFQISGTVSGMVIGVWKPIAVTLTNPNTAPIYVSALTVNIGPDSSPSGCSTASNVELQQSNLSAALTVLVPAGGSVTLPAQGAVAPRIRLKDLPNVNQDICKGKSFSLTYSGTANN